MRKRDRRREKDKNSSVEKERMQKIERESVKERLWSKQEEIWGSLKGAAQHHGKCLAQLDSVSLRKHNLKQQRIVL